MRQVDKLIQLLESLRLQLLEPHSYCHLIKCLYGLLMLLPQASKSHGRGAAVACHPLASSHGPDLARRAMRRRRPTPPYAIGSIASRSLPARWRPLTCTSISPHIRAGTIATPSSAARLARLPPFLPPPIQHDDRPIVQEQVEKDTIQG